jgi:hypothetical protein
MYQYEVDEARRLITATFEGEVTDADLFDYLVAMLARTDYGAGWHSLIDFMNVAAMRLTSAGVLKLRSLPPEMEQRLHGARAVIVAPSGSAAFGMARMYEMLGSGQPYQIAVMSDRDEAMTWLYAQD